MRIRAWVVAAIALAVVAALLAQDRPGAPRGLSAGPAAAYLATQLATLGYGPGGDNGTYFQLGWRLASDPVMPAYNPNEQFARVRK